MKSSAIWKGVLAAMVGASAVANQAYAAPKPMAAMQAVLDAQQSLGHMPASTHELSYGSGQQLIAAFGSR